MSQRRVTTEKAPDISRKGTTMSGAMTSPELAPIATRLVVRSTSLISRYKFFSKIGRDRRTRS